AEHLRQNGFVAIFNSGFGLLENCGAAGERLDTTFVAAAAFRAVDVHDHMADLTGSMVGAAEQFAVQDESTANAGAHKDADDMLGFGFKFGDMHAEDGDVRVVLDKYLHPKLLLLLLLQSYVLPAF